MLSDNIKILRKKKGYSQETMAEQLHVVRQTISKWEKGISVPDAVMLDRMAELFEVPVSVLLGGGLDSGTSYEVELSAEDTVGNVRVVRYTAATSRVTLHLRAGGMGAAFGKYAEQEALECVWPAVFYGDVAVSGALTVNGQTVEAMLFPVGSVRLTDSPAAPETPAGAVWESVETGIAGVYGWRRTT